MIEYCYKTPNSGRGMTDMDTNVRKAKILIGCGDNASRIEYVTNLKRLGYGSLCMATDTSGVLRTIGNEFPDIVLLDSHLPGGDVIVLIRDIRSLIAAPAILFVDDFGNQRLFYEATEEGAEFCLTKPIEYERLDERIGRLMVRREGQSMGIGRNSPVTQRELEMQITKMLHEIGVPANIRGYQYLRMAILLTVMDGDSISPKAKVLYPSIAKLFNATYSRVERAIRHAIEVAWDRGDADVLYEYFGYTVQSTKGKPTNSEFIAMIADHVRLANKV